MDNHLTWHIEQYITGVVGAVLMLLALFPDAVTSPHIPARRNGTGLPYSSQNNKVPTDYDRISVTRLQTQAAVQRRRTLSDIDYVRATSLELLLLVAEG